MNDQELHQDTEANVKILSAIDNINMHPEWYDIAASTHFWMQWRLNVCLTLLKCHHIPLNRELKVLDIGCGHGVLITQLEEVSQWIIDGADINMAALRKGGRSRGRKYFYDITDHNVSLVGAYDVVLLFDVIEHIATPFDFLESALRHVKPGGYLIVNVPAIQSLYSAYDRAAEHIRRYEKQSLAIEFSGLAVDIIEMAYWGMSLIPVLAVRKLLLTNKTENGEILQKGFDVVNPMVNRLFLSLMTVETALLKHPPLGASLFAILQKQ